MDRRELIIANIKDLVSSFMYYDRKEDDLLPRGAIEEALEMGEIKKLEILAVFQDEFMEVVKDIDSSEEAVTARRNALDNTKD